VDSPAGNGQVRAGDERDHVSTLSPPTKPKWQRIPSRRRGRHETMQVALGASRPRPCPESSRAWLWYLAACSVAGAAYYIVPALHVLPRWIPKVFLYNGIGVSSVVAIIVGIRRHRPAQARAWYLFAAGLLSFVTADIIFYTYQDILGVHIFPSAADVFYLASYPFVMAGLLLLIRSRAPGRDLPSLLDALVIASGAAMLSWVFLIVPLAHDQGLSLAERLVAIAYPVMDLLVLVTVVRLAVGRGQRPPGFYLLGLSVIALLLTDACYSYLQLSGGYHTGSPIDVGWMLWYAGWGAAALHPSMAVLGDRATDREVQLTRGRFALLAGGAMVAPTVLAIEALRGHPLEVGVVAAGSAMLFLFVLARMYGLARKVAAQAAERKRLLDRTVEAREEERIRVAADLHDGPIQRLASMTYMAELARTRVAGRGGDTEANLIGSLGSQISEEVRALRRLMAELRPPALDDWGLPAALVEYGAEFQERTGIRCTVQADLPARLGSSSETLLYRVAQEALNNVHKHAQAANVRVTLTAEPGTVLLEVRDDGRGFDVTRTQELLGRDHYGLASMRQRVEMAGGSCKIVSREGSGSAVLVSIAIPG
jgi:signal transduction histidine kinase